MYLKTQSFAHCNRSSLQSGYKTYAVKELPGLSKKQDKIFTFLTNSVTLSFSPIKPFRMENITLSNALAMDACTGNLYTKSNTPVYPTFFRQYFTFPSQYLSVSGQYLTFPRQYLIIPGLYLSVQRQYLVVPGQYLPDRRQYLTVRRQYLIVPRQYLTVPKSLPSRSKLSKFLILGKLMVVSKQ